MKEPYEKGLAIHSLGPEFCGVHREMRGEA
jgi:hypothetical protein